jgi:hypothetical protein
LIDEAKVRLEDWFVEYMRELPDIMERYVEEKGMPLEVALSIVQANINIGVAKALKKGDKVIVNDE